MATTQVASLNNVGQMKRVHFQPEQDGPPEPHSTSQFVSPKKVFKSPNNRKRSASFSFTDSKYHFKRRRKEEFVRPTQFLLGGNSRDPLNLGSLADEKVNKALNEHTPESSPLPTPKHRKEEIEVLIPPNICDPLNLSVPDDDLAERALISPSAVTKRRKIRNRKRRRTNSASEVLEAGSSGITVAQDILDIVKNQTEVKTRETPVAEAKELESNVGGVRDFKELKFKTESVRHLRRSEDKIVSPVVPQPGSRKRSGFFSRSSSKEGSSTKGHHKQLIRQGSKDSTNVVSKNTSKLFISGPNKCKERFQYGNYDRYYGYRTPNNEDPRIRCFRREWFENKDVLDIGCNAGHVTLSIARDFHPRQIIGIDIDPKLISTARKNVQRYISSHSEEEQFPISMPLMYGPIPCASSSSSNFPKNVSFVQGNYVPESDELLELVQPEYDVILCLSVTKWIHLNWGDSGLKRFFRRIYANLRPGGKLILEAQRWASYNRRKKLTEQISLNYAAIQLYPERFGDFLLSQVGFSTCEEIAIPHHVSQGFRRPIHLFTKGPEVSS